MNIHRITNEIVRCPACNQRTHPEYLRYVTKTGYVVGCSTCKRDIRKEKCS